MLKRDIKTHVKSLNKHEKIRIHKWVTFSQIEKLSHPMENPFWKRIRNNHSVSLLEMLKSNKLEGPFLKLPPDGPIQNLSIEVPSMKSSKPKISFKPKQEKNEESDKENASSIESLKIELKKSHERENFLKKELLVNTNQISAHLINEQDQIISSLKEKLNQSTSEDLFYLDSLETKAKILSLNNYMLINEDWVQEYSSIHEI